MRLTIHLLNDAQLQALIRFLTQSIDFQRSYSVVIATDDTDHDFLEIFGFTKNDLEAAIDALEKSIRE